MKNSRGFTLVEFVMTLSLSAVLAGAFVGMAVPQINLFFFLPQRMRVQNAAYDLMNAVMEGDDKADGARYCGPLPGSSTGVGVVTAEAATFSYTYSDEDLTNHTITLSYDSQNKKVTRTVDGGPAQALPIYLTAASGIDVAPSEGNFFRYYASGGSELSSPAAPGAVYRVDVAFRVLSGSGAVSESEGSFTMKSGVEIRHTA